MSEPLPPINQLPYFTPAIPFNPRPLSVSIIAWFAIVIGGIGLLSPFCIYVSHLVPQPPNPVLDAMNGNRLWHAINLGNQIAGWFVSIVLLVGGIQSLRLKEVGRKLLIGYAYYAILNAIAGLVTASTILLPMLYKLMLQHPNDPSITMGFWSGVIGFVFAFIFGIFCIWAILYFLNRPHVKAAFALSPQQNQVIPQPPDSSTSGGEFPPGNHNLPSR
jgi:hypothetical protein